MAMVRNEKRKLPDDEVEQDAESLERDFENKLCNTFNDKDNSCVNLGTQDNGNFSTNSVSIDCNEANGNVFSFTCENCDFESDYTTSEEFLKFFHDCSSFKCLICSLIFNRKRDIAKHITCHSSDATSISIQSLFKEVCLGSLTLIRPLQNIKCSRCSFECKDKNIFENHMLIHNSIQLTKDGNGNVFSFTCENCDFESDYTTSEEFLKFFHDCSSFKCLICSLIFNRKRDIAKHITCHSSDATSISIQSLFKEVCLGSLTLIRPLQNIKCSRCSFECKDKNIFENHMLIHNSIQLTKDGNGNVFSFTCENCDFESDYTTSEEFLKFFHDCSSFKCLICSLIFNRKRDIAKHITCHSSDATSISIQSLFKEVCLGSLTLIRPLQNIKCSRCSFECKDKNIFENHMLIHNSIQLTKDNLNSNNKTLNFKGKPFVREEFIPEILKYQDNNFEVNNRKDLVGHLTLYEANYIKCSKCNFETNNSKWLERHLFIHEPDQNKCPKCSFKSGEKEILGQHLLTHESVYFRCSNCSFICSCKSSFKIHLLNHEPALFQCSKCDLLCNQKFDFENHISKHSKNFHCSKRVFLSPDQYEFDHPSKKYETMINKCTKCRFKGSNKEDLENHLFLHYQGEVFECTECSFVTSVESELKDHMKVHLYHCNKCDFKSISSKDGKRKVDHECVKKCPACDFKTDDTEKMYSHKFKHKELFKYKCSQCRHKSNSESSFEKHQLIHAKVYKCLHCVFETNKLTKYDRHSAKHKGNIIKCKKCGYETLHKIDFNNHHKRAHSTLAVKCSECNYECRSKQTLKNHMSRHTGVYKNSCTHCEYKTSDNSNFETHMLSHVKEKQFICSQCNFSTKTQVSLSSHLRIHGDKKRFKCDKCDYETNYKHNLTTHVLKHTNVRLFNCDQCDYTSNYKFCIERHIQITHDKDAKEEESSNAKDDSERRGKKSFKSKQLHQCPQCDYTTSYIGNLRVHKVTSHSKREDYSCPHCKYATKSKDSFDLHSVDHLEVLKCFYCDFAPDSKPDLRKHVLQHQKTSNKKFECNDCGFVTFSKVGFSQHKRTHLKNKELKCPSCEYATNFKGNLTKHIKLKHREEESIE